MKCKYILLLAAIFFYEGIVHAQVYNINEFGAAGDGKKVNTKFIQSAIDSCAANGGGTVLVPQGVFITGTVHLKSNIELHLESGAVIKGSPDLNDYEIYIPDTPFQKVHKGMFFTEDAVNVSITGSGQIDGNGDLFFNLNKAKEIEWGGKKYTRQKDDFRKVVSGIGDGPVVPLERPYQMFVFSSCKRVTVKDIFVTSSPFWTMHFADCDAVNVSGIRLWTNMLVPNADGIDITSCNNVIISNCDIRSGDDAVVVAGYDHHFEIPGYRKLRHTSENIVVTNCNLQSASSAIRVGWQDQNSVRNIRFSNINITNSTRGIGIFLRDEGSLENIRFNNIYIETKLRTGDWWGNAEPIHISAVKGKEKVKLGRIKNVQFSNIICKGENGMLLYGSDESMIEGVSFNNVKFELTDSKLNDVAGGNIDLRGALRDTEQLFKRDIPGLYLHYVKNISINQFELKWTGTRMPYFTHGIEAEHFSGLSIENFNGSASPINKTAFRILATDGEGLKTDNSKGLLKKNIRL